MAASAREFGLLALKARTWHPRNFKGSRKDAYRPDKQSGRAGEIRTHDFLHPMQALYQAELQPVTGWPLQLDDMNRVVEECKAWI